jgi:hypothetical protein
MRLKSLLLVFVLFPTIVFAMDTGTLNVKGDLQVQEDLTVDNSIYVTNGVISGETTAQDYYSSIFGVTTNTAATESTPGFVSIALEGNDPDGYESIDFVNNGVGFATIFLNDSGTTYNDSSTAILFPKSLVIENNSDGGKIFFLSTGGGSGGTFHFFTGPYLADEKVTILSNGSVGIGDTTPDYNLDVVGTLGVDGAIYTPSLSISGTAERWAGNTYPANYIDFNDSATAVTVSTELNITGVTGSGKAVCVKADGNLGVCSDAVGESGTCTCS